VNQLSPIPFFILNSAFAARPGQCIKDFPAGRFAGFFPGPGFVGDGYARPSRSMPMLFTSCGVVEWDQPHAV